jgi:hypothetical protein
MDASWGFFNEVKRQQGKKDASNWPSRLDPKRTIFVLKIRFFGYFLVFVAFYSDYQKYYLVLFGLYGNVLTVPFDWQNACFSFAGKTFAC